MAKAGYKIAHIDPNPYYGASEASLTVEEFLQWGNSTSSDISFECQSASPFPQSRQYSISLCPSIIAATGPLISSLVGSGVARYGGFRLVESVGVYSKDGSISPVPGSKEDVFRNKAISLVDKRRLMRFLMFALQTEDFETAKELQEGNGSKPFVQFLGDVFNLKGDIVVAIAYALAYCFSETGGFSHIFSKLANAYTLFFSSEDALTALNRTRRYLRSSGRYGASPFLVGQYGSTGEIAQGFCRTAAVAGAVYILGRGISSISKTAKSTDEPTYTLHLDDFPDPITCNVLISPQESLPSNTLLEDAFTVKSEAPPLSGAVARAVIIVDHPPQLLRSSLPLPEEVPDDEEQGEAQPPSPKPVDAGVIVFPPSVLPESLSDTAVHVLISGEGTMSTPAGKCEYSDCIHSQGLTHDPGIIYFSAPISQTKDKSPREILTPYVEATLRLGGQETAPLLSAYYWDKQPPSSSPIDAPVNSEHATCIVSPRLSHAHPLPETPDIAARDGENVFWKALELLKRWKSIGLCPP